MRTTRASLLTASCGWIAAALSLDPAGLGAQNAEPRIWQGVYTTAQAERGRATFNTACLRCHGPDLAGNTAPALKGERFQSSWGGDTIENLFVKIRDTMPPNFGTILDDQTKLDIVSYILQVNGFPAGKTELALGGADLVRSEIVQREPQAVVLNFSLIETVGCLARGANNTWLLTRTAEPRATRDDTPTEQHLAAAAGRPLGMRTFLLLSAVPFRPDAHEGRRMEARGLVYTEPGDERITLTSLRPAGERCDP
jgi:mono/diheme cytochrome c family protein